MEATIVFWCYIGVMEKKMVATIICLQESRCEYRYHFGVHVGVIHPKP